MFPPFIASLQISIQRQILSFGKSEVIRWVHCGELLVRALANGRQFLHVVREHGAPGSKLVDLGEQSTRRRPLARQDARAPPVGRLAPAPGGDSGCTEAPA